MLAYFLKCVNTSDVVLFRLLPEETPSYTISSQMFLEGEVPFVRAKEG